MWSCLLLLATTQALAGPAVERLMDGIAVKFGERRLEVRVCRDEIARVVYAPPGPFFSR